MTEQQALLKKAITKSAAALGSAADFIRTLQGWRRWLAAFFAGIAAALALAPVYALPLLVVGFSVLIVLLDKSAASARPLRSAFFIGWLFGFGYFLAGIYWMAFSFFVQADQFAWMAPFAVTGMPAFLALFTGAAALLSVRFWRDGWARIVLFAAVWSVFEYLRGHILTGLPWNLTGQALAGSAIGAQTAAWYGVYGLSLITVLLASAPAAGLSDIAGRPLGPRQRLMGVAVMLGGTALLFALGAARLAAPDPAPDGKHFVRIVQPNIPQREKIDPDYWGRNFHRQLELSKGAAPKDGRVFVIWPENGAPLLNEAETALGLLSEELPENAILIAGAVRRATGDDGVLRYYNSIQTFAQTPKGRRAVGAYDKHHLVPFGEYLPFYGLLNAVGLAQLAPYGDSGFAAGPGPRVMNAGGPSFAPLICYEVIFPGALYPKGERPEWLLTVTNDAWFGDTSGPRQHLDQARLRSIETGLPMARSANTGISAMVDAKGRILQRVPLYESGKIESALPAPLPPTLYERLGDWVYAVMVFVLLGWVISRRK
ncbi:MAG: apolipoprotein N-acyltransferase [Hyphococcus sp.]|nr:MAG: apolipoprotein N-acyltransferase [Marinicaulis sp.]